jgi:type III pantothenate kinase
MLLAIDVGNTSIALGVFDDEDLISTFSIETNKNSTQSEFSTILSKSLNEKEINLSQINSSIISCVVPEVMDIISDSIKELFNSLPVVVSKSSKTNMPILYDDPEEVGADRIVNSVAAYNMFKSSAVVVDFGTATTFDCISGDGEYLGGSIAPGIKISSDALSLQASKLPKVDIIKPGNVIGKNTVESMQSGIVFGYVS